MLKARTLFEQTGKPVIADDSGLCVRGLDGAPGIFSARYGGEGLTDEERYIKLLEEMKDIQTPHRGARFICVIVVYFGEEDYHVLRGECEGTILEEPQGREGFGYDPVFFVSELGLPMAELSMDEKNKISHRGKAVEKLVNYLKLL